MWLMRIIIHTQFVYPSRHTTCDINCNNTHCRYFSNDYCHLTFLFHITRQLLHDNSSLQLKKYVEIMKLWCTLVRNSYSLKRIYTYVYKFVTFNNKHIYRYFAIALFHLHKTKSCVKKSWKKNSKNVLTEC